MKKLFSLILLSPMMLGKESLPIGKEVEFEQNDYLALIDRGVAKPKNKKQYTSLKDKVEKEKLQKEELKVRAYAIEKQTELKQSANQLAMELKSLFELIEDAEFKTLLLHNSFFIMEGPGDKE